MRWVVLGWCALFFVVVTLRIHAIERANQQSNQLLEKAKGVLKKQVNEQTEQLQYQQIALNEHAIVSITDEKSNISYVNDKFIEISGYSEDELIGQNHRILKSVYD